MFDDCDDDSTVPRFLGAGKRPGRAPRAAPIPAGASPSILRGQGPTIKSCGFPRRYCSRGPITLREKVDVARLRVILANRGALFDEIFSVSSKQGKDRDSHLTLLSLYYQRAKESEKKDGTAEVPVLYYQNDNMGRYMAENGLGLQIITRRVRHTISGRWYLDVDVVNAHPVFLLWYCERHHIPCAHLRILVSDRKEVFRRAIDRGVGKDDAEVKRAFLAALNGGGAPRWNEITWDFYLGFHQEMYEIHESVAALEPSLFAYVAALPSKKKYPASTAARTANRVLLHIENAVLLAMVDYFNTTHLVPEVLTYDGCQVRRTKLFTEKEVLYHLRKAEDHVLGDLGVAITLDTKPMDNVIDLSGYTAGEFIDDWDRFHHILTTSLACKF